MTATIELAPAARHARGWTLALTAVLASLLCYCLALVLPGLVVDHRSRSIPGYALLIFGWVEVFYGHPAWLANLALPLYYATTLLRWHRTTMLTGAGMVLLGLTTLTVDEALMDEGGGKAEIVGVGVGFAFWMASLTIPALAAVIGWARTPRRQSS